MWIKTEQGIVNAAYVVDVHIGEVAGRGFSLYIELASGRHCVLSQHKTKAEAEAALEAVAEKLGALTL